MTRLVLAGAGHTHVEVLRRFARRLPPGVEVIVVAPASGLLYSGMVPGVVAGVYGVAEATIDVVSLARAAGARFILDSVDGLEPDRRRVTLAGGATIDFDVLSLDVGATTATPPMTGAASAVPVRPLAGLIAAWQRMRAAAANGTISSIAVIGGGAAGVELAFAISFRLRADLAARAPAVTLVTDQSEVAPTHSAGTRRRLKRLLASRDIALVARSAVVAIDATGIALTDGRRVAAQGVIVATAAVAEPWLRTSGIACDAAGFVQVDASLRSVSHPSVFAAGDCAQQVDAPRPRSGVYAVRAGPPLAENLARVLDRRALVTYRPQRAALALISVGGGYAVASRGPLSAEGAWVWRWKDYIDRGFVARYRAGA